ncbi:MAG TPA: ABC transporter permease subunit [Kiritimatiellia bacterium]|nr:ABC transporter permease subunit [Kiritimatiellia bacterium]HRZ11409.1 ABC transporter permease subunit [Kiritimatiellia bacterium]HSA17040.1 ABC transporter permease subunit [Kiritimatiellia bacterium]
MNESAQSDLIRRRLAGLSRALLIYGLLVGGAAVFALPFVWMIGTSFKVDREIFGGKITIFPMRPDPVAASPYMDARYYREPTDADYPRVKPVIEQVLAESGAGDADILAPGLHERLKQVLPDAAWKGTDGELGAAARARLTPELIEDVRDNVARALLLGPVRVRSFDLQEADLTEGAPVSAFWTVESPVVARLVDETNATPPAAVLNYDFGDQRDASITLTTTLDLPFAADRLHRVTLFLRPDDSWHPLDFTLEKGGTLYRGKRPEYLGNFNWGSVTLQEAGPDDESTKIRLWLPYEKVDAGSQYESRPDKAKLTVILRRNTQAGAWWAKVQRNYRGALDYLPFWRYAATSVFLVILNIVGNVFSCSLVAYAFARLRWPGRDLTFGVMLATMMIPPQVTMIPYFLIIKSLGWYNTLTPLWFVSFFGNAFNIFLLRQFMKGIPRDLEDAAKIDGCNVWQIYWNVILPLIKPTLACIAIFTFMGVWNDFMGPLIYLSDQRLYPLSLGLYAFNVQAGGNYGMMMAGSLMMTLPVVVIFFFAQKYFIQGVTLTGMKG